VSLGSDRNLVSVFASEYQAEDVHCPETLEGNESVFDDLHSLMFSLLLTFLVSLKSDIFTVKALFL
jgi:hypothetical protein